jgi:hypothetical protein
VNAEFPRTTYERATREYDETFQRELISEIITAIAKASICTDTNVMALRTGETIEAVATIRQFIDVIRGRA